MAADAAVIEWLMEGDAAIRWQVVRDLVDAPHARYEFERERLTTNGWGAAFLRLQHDDGSWGAHVYAKWDGTFYTMLVMREIGLPAEHVAARRAARLILDEGHRPKDGGLCFGRSHDAGETCISGMGMSILARYSADDSRISALADYLVAEQMPDGGWNCRYRRGATHSSFHTTISVLEGLLEWRERSADPRVNECLGRGHEFLFTHRMFRSHVSGNVVKSEFKQFHFPPRWHYDVLRGLDHLRAAGAARDERLAEAIELVRAARKPGGHWNLSASYRGQESFVMERAGEPSRWNTLRCMRVLRWWEGK